MNHLFYGDNLDVLRRYVRDESVDLVYLDPPFNSNQDYNVLFREHSGTRAAAQIKAFEDTWRWDAAAVEAYEDAVHQGGKVAEALIAFRAFLGASDMMAYLSMMAPRLLELRRVLRKTGSLYLHCDPTASHYLKILLDGVFGAANFRSEIVWKRSSAHSDTKQGRRIHGHIHDIILFYTKSDEWTWNPQYTPYDHDYLANEYRHEHPDGRRYKETDLTAARPGGDTTYDWRVKRRAKSNSRWEADVSGEYERPRRGWEYAAVKPYSGRYWAYAIENMREFAKQGKLIHRSTGMPRLIQFADEMPGVPLQDLWVDIPPLGPKAAERLGYPTQKPEALLERIIRTSSNEGDVVLDPFCGCGTAVASAQRMERTWIGIDITHLAIGLIKSRLQDSFGDQVAETYQVIGEPTDIGGARQLAADDPYQFQFWALGLVGARGTEQKKGADRGIDGRLYFHDEGRAQNTKQVILSVKAGHTSVPHVRDLRGVLDRENAQIGVLISLQEPTAAMRSEAASAGSWESRWGTRHPRIQLLTIAELLAGRRIDYPRTPGSNVTLRKAPTWRKRRSEQMELEDVSMVVGFPQEREKPGRKSAQSVPGKQPRARKKGRA